MMEAAGVAAATIEELKVSVLFVMCVCVWMNAREECSVLGTHARQERHRPRCGRPQRQVVSAAALHPPMRTRRPHARPTPPGRAGGGARGGGGARRPARDEGGHRAQGAAAGGHHREPGACARVGVCRGGVAVPNNAAMQKLCARLAVCMHMSLLPLQAARAR
jgi:hypothetical protein